MFKAAFVPTVIVAALAAGSASAADLAMKPADPIAPVATAYDWTGPYIGLHAGYGWGNEDDNQSTLSEGGPAPVPEVPADKFSIDGFVGGAHAGYNYQIDQFVLGVEGDIDYTNLEGSHRFTVPAPSGVLSFKTEWQGSARLRAGYAIDNFLLYATGGLAFAQGKLTSRGVDDSNTHFGWTVGVGAEYAFTQNWIGRAEVRYSDFQKKSYDTPDGRVKAGWNQTTATVGISYKF
ncbi:MAG TPA: outer membrane protein [Burkholderiales bacterium]